MTAPTTISKLARDPDAFRRAAVSYPSARAAFLAALGALELGPGRRVVLPAFVGWSPREGSGVFDPVRELGVPYAFYRVTEQLDVDVEHLRSLLEVGDVAVVVLIHYFGRVSPATAAHAALARAHGAVVIEDEAHALFSDLVTGAGGRFGDACLLSLHKMLPLPDGGTLLVNAGADPRLHGLVGRSTGTIGATLDSWDLAGIAARRRANTACLRAALAPLAGEVDPLWPDVEPESVLQTFPVVVRRVSRDALYHAMNAAGFGVVSLYHTMIRELSADAFPTSHVLARRILNLPVHQDATPEQMTALAAELARQVASAPVATS